MDSFDRGHLHSVHAYLRVTLWAAVEEGLGIVEFARKLGMDEAVVRAQLEPSFSLDEAPPIDTAVLAGVLVLGRRDYMLDAFQAIYGVTLNPGPVMLGESAVEGMFAGLTGEQIAL